MMGRVDGNGGLHQQIYGNIMRIWGCNNYVKYKHQDDSLGVSENWLASFKRKSDDKHYN